MVTKISCNKLWTMEYIERTKNISSIYISLID